MQNKCVCCFKDGCRIKLSHENVQQLQELTGDCGGVDKTFNTKSSICAQCVAKLADFANFRLKIVKTQKKFQHISRFEAIKQEPPDDEPAHQSAIKKEMVQSDANAPLPIINIEERSDKMLCPQRIKLPSSTVAVEVKRRRKRKNTPSEKDHFCTYCDKYFTEARKVKEHIRRVHLKRRDFHCDHCSYSAYKKYDIFLHISNIHKPKSSLEKTAVCPTCGLAFLTNSRLNIHIRRKHMKAIMRKISCDVCGHRTATLNEMRCHMNVHFSKELRERYKCNYCEAVFYSKGSLKTHKDVKHLLTDFEIRCFCGKVFKQKSVYQRHYDVIHLGKKHFKCPKCSKCFSGKTHLKYHQRAAHSEVTTSIPCEICGTLYKSLETLKRHMIYHSEPKFKCNDCGRMFHENKKLMDHQSVHRCLEYACLHCDKSFRLETQYNYHLKKVHFKEKLTFKCELCLSSFTRKSTYRDHALRQHKELDQDAMTEFLKRIKKCLPEEHKNT